MDRELARQLFHIVVGLAAIAALLVLGRGFMIAAVFFIIIFGLILINARLIGLDIQLVRWFEERFEREHAPVPGWGSACYAAGALIALSILTNVGSIAAVFVALALGDGLSTIVGMHGKIKLPYNKRKTFEGVVVMFMASLLSYFFVGPIAIPMAILAALTESLPVLEDNLSVPIVCTLILAIV